jgi:hypothetical protein
MGVLDRALSYDTGPNILSGLIMSTAGSSATLTVAAGYAMDSTNLRLMKLASSLAKTTAAWVAGAGGGLDTGTIANSTWYHWHLILNPATGVVDVLCSLSASAPTLPGGFTLFRRIGSALTNASAQWVKFVQLGDEFLWAVPVQDISSASFSTVATLVTLSVPTGIQVWANTYGVTNNPSATILVLLTSPDQTDTAASASVFNIFIPVAGQNTNYTATLRTSTSAQIRVRASASSTTVLVNTFGWIDTRGKVA